MELFKGSNLNKIINNEMFAHMRMQFENLALDIDVDVEDVDGNIIRVNVVNKALNSWMMEVFKGSNLNETQVNYCRGTGLFWQKSKVKFKN